jgi:DNA mismatch repair protein MutS
MDAALGPPEKMADRRDDLTPMMAQYFELCDAYDDSLVLFQVGDFYEAFCEAAEVVARRCEITLTKREDNTGTYPMAGIPIDNAETYVERLLSAGYRVAIADQVGDPDAAGGVVERAVTRVVTPGMLTEDELLAGDDNNFVASLAREGDEYGLALLDVSTGEFVATAVDGADRVADEVGRFDPAEAIVAPDVDVDPFPADCVVDAYDPGAFDLAAAAETLSAYFPGADRRLAGDAEVRACGALLAYAEYARGGTGLSRGDPQAGQDGAATADDGRLAYINRLRRYDPQEYMLLDAVAVESLELFERRGVRADDEATLFDVVDETASAMGSRRLRDWLRRPLIDADDIAARHEAVGEFVREVDARERLRDLLREVYDLERLISRIARGRGNARDLQSLADSLSVVPEIRSVVAEAEADLLADLHDRADPMDDVRDLVDRAVVDEPPIEVTEGGVIADGYDEDLDDLRATSREGKRWIEDLEASERERTGIDSLKIGHNQVHGYYIEVTDANLDRVPDDYRRRQTLKNSERFVTPDLERREDEIVSAEARAQDAEYRLFREVRAAVADEADRVQELADALADLDALVGLATVAATHDYHRPTVGAEGIHVEGGRHPVVERTQESFVPNDVHLDRAPGGLTNGRASKKRAGSAPTREEGGPTDGRASEQAAGEDGFVAVITGPNMSGKSTYMRQVALIVILAQAGSFVPASAARLRIVDRVFTRVGASDDIPGGRSTFMVEMTELAEICAGATRDSLVLLDEVGRGTATTDGLAIARAVTEYLHDDLGATTLFATHHHELTTAADRLAGVENRHFAASADDEGAVTFDHNVREGAAEASYGVEVARTAGVPERVVDRAAELLAAETGDAGATGETPSEREAADGDAGATGETRAGADAAAAPDLADGERAAVEQLRSLTVADTTPMEALRLLDELQRDLQE